MASLPLVLHKRGADGAKSRYTNHSLYRLLHDAPSPEQTSFNFRAALMMNALSTGNGYAEIERDGAGRPVALWHIDPNRVSLRRDPTQWVYEVTNPQKGPTHLSASDMLHIKGPNPDGILGMHTVTVAREALGMAIAAERFGATYFSNGAQFGGLISTNMTGLTLENVRTALAARHQGVDRAHRFLPVPQGTTFEEFGTSPKDSQLTELRESQVREIARFFRIPVAMIGDLSRATGSNFEQQQLQYY